MYPPIASNSRIYLKDDVIDIEGTRYFLAGGTTVAWGVYQSQQRKDIWGGDASIWKPCRWLGQNAVPATENAAFLAWGSGPRIVRSAKRNVQLTHLIEIIVHRSGAWWVWNVKSLQGLAHSLTIAYMEATYVTSRLLQSFHNIEPALDVQPRSSWVGGEIGGQIMPEAPVITLRLRGGLWLRFHS